MRASQVIFVIAIALGAGLFASGSYLDPAVNLTDPASMQHLMDYRYQSNHETAAILRGVGIGCMVLGGFGLIVPWVNTLLARRMTTNPSGSAM